jgi:hypothetical protein
MRRVKALSLLVVSFALCLLPYMTSAQAGVEMVLQVYNGGPVTMYERPSLSSPVLYAIGNNDRFIWRADRMEAEGRQWFYVQLDRFFGWISPDDGVVDFADPTAITPLMDRSVTATVVANPINLHSAPGRFSPVVATLPIGTQVRVMDAPVVVDLYTWWKVRVLPSGAEGWLADTVRALQVIAPLRVYGYQVCDNFNLKEFGMTGWDSIVSVLPRLLDAGERVECLASTKLDSGVSPIVVVLARREGATPRDSLRAFALRGGVWTPIFTQYTEEFARTDRLSLHNLTDDPFPTLIWNVRLDGTGSVLQNYLLRFNPATGLVEAQTMGNFYKGFMQINGRQMTFFQANYLPDEPNCCPSGVDRYVFEWFDGRFAPIIFDVLPLPFAIQSSRR